MNAGGVGANEVDVQTLLRYIWLAGWEQGPEEEGRSAWHRSVDGRDLLAVVPGSNNVPAAQDQIAEALAVVAYAERRTLTELLTDLRSDGADTVSVRLLPDGLPGRAPLSLASEAMAGLRQLVVGSATALTSDSLVLPSRRPVRAEMYAAKAQLATLPGSFILDLALPLHDQEIEEQTTEGLFELNALPYGRLVANRMQDTALRALAKAKEVSTNEADLSDFGVANLRLGNSTELEGLARLGGDEGMEYRLRFTQSAFADRRAPSQILAVSGDEQEVLARASEYLRSSQPRPGVTIEGLVVRLFRQGSLGPGEVTVQAVLDDSGRQKRCKLSLGQDDYDEAVRAHSEGRFIVAKGDLESAGSRKRLVRLQAFTVIAGIDEE